MPQPNALSERIDFFGNQTAFFSLQDDHDQLEVQALSEVEVLAPETPIPELTPAWESVRDTLRDNGVNNLEAMDFLYESAYVKTHPLFAEYALKSFTEGRPILSAQLPQKN